MEFARASRAIAAPSERLVPLSGTGLAWVGERKVRTPQGSVLANGEGLRGIPDSSGRTPQARKVPQKTYRPVLLRLAGVETG